MKLLLSKNKTTNYLRLIHRNLGFLMVGVCIVYGISGILLNHMGNNDPAFKTEEKELMVDKELDESQLGKALSKYSELPSIINIVRIDHEHLRIMFQGGIGVYNKTSGVTDIEIHSERKLISWINKLHYNRLNGWYIMADFFAVSLVFFAISGIFLVKGKKGIAGKGKWYLIAGLLIPLAYIVLS